MRTLLVSLLSLYIFAIAAHAKTYKLKQSLAGQKLLDAFTWQTGSVPSLSLSLSRLFFIRDEPYLPIHTRQSDNGAIAMYNSQASAKQKGLVSIAKNGAVKLGVSTQQYQSLRDSVRLVSKQTSVSEPRNPPREST